MKIKTAFLIICLLAAILLAGCEELKIPEEGISYVPPEEIRVEGENMPSGNVGLSIADGIVTFTLENMPLIENNVYEGWIVDEETGTRESVGIIKINENGTGKLSYGAGKDISDFDSVIITLEPVPDDYPGPSDIIILKGDIAGEGNEISVELKQVAIIEEKPEEAPAEEFPEEIIEIPETPVEEEEEAEITEEEVKEEEKATVIIVEETDAVSLVPKAADPDADQLSYTFTTPLDENGEWETNYGDAGEYKVTVTASDGTLSTSKDVLLIVNKKEEAPSINKAMPEEAALDVKEDAELKFSAEASDKNKDPLAYSWKIDGAEVSTKNEYNYKIGFEDAGSHTVKLDVSDGTLTTSKIWSLTVRNVNRAPVLEKIGDMAVKETQTVTIEPSAADPDNDGLEFTISDPVGDDGTWETTYDDAGEYNVTVTASDGTDMASQTFKIKVENVNRPPVISEIVQR